MDMQSVIQDLFYNENYNSLTALLDRVNALYESSVRTNDSVTKDFVDNDFLNEIRNLSYSDIVCIYFGRTFRDVKCVIKDQHNREHSVFIEYIAKNKLSIASTTLPHSAYQDREFINVEEVIKAFIDHVQSLTNYFMELERIDSCCCVIEPVKPTFKDETRKILLAERVWLHIEVTPSGAAANIHLIGNTEMWYEKLQTGLTNWDHDKDIVDNVMRIFDMQCLPLVAIQDSQLIQSILAPEQLLCGICLCTELETLAVPQPLCTNNKCGAYYHKHCLFQWLVSCAGGRIPTLGVATGPCPSCLEPISCCQMDT